MPQREPGKHDTDTDVMRIIAAFGVVLIHCSTLGSFAGIFWESLTRFAVPVFILISGYYMLMRRSEPAAIGKKCVRLFVLMILWSALFYLKKGYEGGGIHEVLSYLLTSPSHLWYLYATIGLYLLTPILQVFTRAADRKVYRYALGVCFVFGSVIVIALRTEAFPVLQKMVDKMRIPYMLGFLFLYLLGGYLHRCGLGSRKQRVWLYLLGILGVIVSFVSALLLPRVGQAKDLLMSYFAPNIMATSIAFFVFVKQLFADHPIRSERACARLRSLSECTLGVYLLHPMVIELVQKHPFFRTASIPVILLKGIVCFALSTGVIFVIRKIPLLKRLTE